MNRIELAKHTIGGSAIAAGIGAIIYVIMVFISYEWNHTLFFLRPENVHYTEYNTPHYITQVLLINAIQDPLVIFSFFIPFVILAIVLIASYREGLYN